jgi:hypothetical protein
MVEALVSIDIRVRNTDANSVRPLTSRTTGSDDTVDFALVHSLALYAVGVGDCLCMFYHSGPSLAAGTAAPTF